MIDVYSGKFRIRLQTSAGVYVLVSLFYQPVRIKPCKHPDLGKLKILFWHEMQTGVSALTPSVRYDFETRQSQLACSCKTPFIK